MKKTKAPKISKKNQLIAGSMVLLTGAACAIVGIAAQIFSEIAIDRKPGKAFMKTKSAIAGSSKAPMAPEMKHILSSVSEASERILNTPMEKLEIESHDGIRLRGCFYPADDQKRIIVCMHGWRSSWAHDFGLISTFFHDELKSSLLLPDQRGQGESDGDYMGFGVLERFDCFEWVKYAVNRFGSDVPIYLCGVSMGAATVLMTTGFELPKNVKGVIADCGFTSPHAIMEHVVRDNLHLSGRFAYPLVNRQMNKKANFDGDEYSTVEALSKAEVPVLFIHGASDHFVPVQMTFENYEACVSPKDLLIVPGADHGLSYFKDNAAYRRAVTAFFEKYDQSRREEILKQIEKEQAEKEQYEEELKKKFDS